jgi:hypothetical protein
LQLPQW